MVTTTARIHRREVSGEASAWRDDVHPVLRRVLAARGASDPAATDYRLGRLLAPAGMGGLDAACALLERALRDGQRVVVVGDYDADGATGTAVAVRGLRMLGATRVGFRVPNRAVHGYGLSPALVEELRADAPDLLLTVDNGIAANAGIAAARAVGIAVLVTDHHLPGRTLPDANAIVDPCVPGDAFGSKALAGVGVAFYLLLALRARLREAGWFDVARPEPDLSGLLDLVALGTVADLVPLDFNNRVLVAAGLRRIRAGRACAGVRALLQVSGRSAGTTTAADLGFALAPRINAAGRLDDMRLGIQCLVTDDAGEALSAAQQLDAMNKQRRGIQSTMQDQADALTAAWSGVRAGALPVGVCVYDPDWHAGVVGLIAGRLKERLNRPTIAFAPGDEASGTLRGSGRSIAGFHLRDALADVAAREPGLIERFGGHAMAAGLTLPADAFDRFAAAFDARARESLGNAPESALFASDGPLAGADATLALADCIADAGPWGQGFDEPAFDNVFSVERWRVVGERHLQMDLAFEPCGTPVAAIWFGGWGGRAPASRLRALYQLHADSWRGERRVRLLVRHVEAA